MVEMFISLMILVDGRSGDCTRSCHDDKGI